RIATVVTSRRPGRLQSKVPAADAPRRGGPLPLLLLRRGTVGPRQLSAIENDARIEMFAVRDLTPESVAVAHRMAGLLVATSCHPLDAFTYAVTSGVSAPILVAVAARHRNQIADLLSAGAAACVVMPVTKAQVDAIVEQLGTRSASTQVDETLRLMLDPI